ncbi:Similar to NADH-ubiquinone oxidoreductase 21 kDa subunit, mitochondrial; acc. no. P25711 [Pyronema omphalodes CBS 100304]|uniref:NADH dehydrogenase [ubiquinone] iron-sulfur protein 4, mitochondrial n=1 Tax=Pyronema omphalodes (strain CBS 100304) TaxID=1076935 RepID=U4L654_PYROM|nr:Similar to NADH-ubiquinone oxidoreductase 21 kDa subunit, mitochondrial; acc. no. P25711 [Pyronema omphalodes CBS 100304]
MFRPAALTARSVALRASYATKATTSVVPRAHSKIAAPSAEDTHVPAPVDTATSCYSPISKHPVNRSENDILDAAVVSGAPIELQARTVRIYKPAKPATQSGNWNGRQWKMDWDVLPRGHRWENPLMGWQSSGDFMQGTHIFFKTKEDAIHFAEKQGYEWFVQEPNTRQFKSKSYASNFEHSPKKLKMIFTK